MRREVFESVENFHQRERRAVRCERGVGEASRSVDGERARVVRESREERGEGEGNSRGEGRRVGAFTEESGTREGLIASRNGLGEESDGSERQL